MRHCTILLVLLMTFLCGYAQQNPFRRPESGKHDTVAVSRIKQSNKTGKSENVLWKMVPFSRKLLLWQRTLSGKLSSVLRNIKTNPHPSTLAVLLLIAFLYGIIHSIGPGHAKTIFISHGLSRATPHCDTWIAGAVFSITHCGSAIILFTILKTLLGGGQREHDMFSNDMAVLSGILIMIAGIIIITSSLIENKAHFMANKLLRRSTGLVPVAAIAGLVPCPGAFLVLTFSSVIGILPAGIAAVAAISSGMAITVSLAGMAGSSIGKLMEGRKNSRVGHIAGAIIRYIAAGVIIAIGAIMVSG